MDDSEEVISLVAEVGRRLQARQDQIVDGMSAMMAADIKGLDEDPQLVKMLYASVDGNIDTIFHVLTNDIPLDHLQPTTAAVEYAIRLAQRGIPSHALRRAYHVGQNNLMDDCFTEVQHLECSPDLRIMVLHRLSLVMSGYIDWITQFVTEAYDAEWQRHIAASGNMLSSLVNRLLGQQPVNAQSFAAETGYDLEQFHIGAVLWVPDHSPATGSVMELERFVQQISNSSRAAGAPIFIAVEHNLGWAWFPRGSNPQPFESGRMLKLAVNVPFRIATGLPHYGASGFRRTHLQAIAARNTALHSANGVGKAPSYGDPGIAIVSMLARDLDATRSWVIEQLGPLARDTPSAGRLRATLHTFLSSGRSYTEAAGLLNLHRNSVKYRVEKAITARGRPITDDRLDVELALQVCQFLGRQVLDTQS